MPIDTHIEGDAAECRATERWLGEVGRAARGAATAINGARTTSEGCWTGASAERFRATAGRLRADGDHAAEQAEKASRALGTFAAALDAAKNAMARARGIALAGGLTVAGEIIQDPVAAPAALPSGPGVPPPSPAQARAHQQAVTAAADQAAAYEQARTVAEDARRDYDRAQQELQDILNPTRDVLQEIKNGLTWASRVYGFPTGLYGGARKWAGIAQEFGDRARMWRELGRTPGLNPAVRAQAFDEMLANRSAAARAAGRAVDNGMLLRGALGSKAVDGVLRAMTANPGQLLENRTGALSRAATPVLKNVPYLGAAVTAFGVGADIKSGRGVGESVARNVIPFAAGTATTAGILAVSAAGGPVTLAAVGAGMLVSYGVGKAVDAWGDDVAEGVGEAKDWVGDKLGSIF